MKAQAIVTSQGRIVSLDIAVNYCHDMKFAKVKTFKMFSTTYRNHRKRFGLRMNLIAGIINHELGF
ncbi:transposase-like protein, IS1381 ISSpn7 [Streptococcus pneumoniae]|nr:transposase-like protein, IS1381 ISSpn7 [Streptococcus pneumoniae]